MKKIFLVLLLVGFAVTLSACDNDDGLNDAGRKQDDPIQEPVDDEPNDEVNDETLELTVAELAAYDGKDGAMAYIAVNDVIYDVTDEWNNGSHNGVNAGADVTSQIMGAPHGQSVLEDLEEVGILVSE